MDRAEARAELWRRYDAGELSADEVEARLVLLDRAGDDDQALRAALDRPVPVHRRIAARRTAIAVGALAVIVVLAGAAMAIVDGSDSREDRIGPGSNQAGADATAGFAVVEAVPVPLPAPAPAPTPMNPDCAIAEDQPEPTDEVPASAALLSEPAFVPEGYDVLDDDDLTPGFDPDIAMSTAAGSPAPVEIRARELDGPLPVRMRLFRHDDADAAVVATTNIAQAACGFNGDRFDVPDRPEIRGFVVSGPIPTTAFASWQLGDRRFVVAVESAGDSDDVIAEAETLAGTIAAAELDAARSG